MAMGIRMAASAAGKGVHRSRFEPEIISPAVEKRFLAQMSQMQSTLKSLGVDHGGIDRIQSILDRVGGDIGSITSIDPRFLPYGHRIFMKPKAIHLLSQIMDRIYGLTSSISDLDTINAILNDQMRKHFLGMIDLSGFKRINDIWEHQTGDRVLDHVVAELLGNEQLLEYARHHKFEFSVMTAGGDEFLVPIKVEQNFFSNGIIAGFFALVRKVLISNTGISKLLVFNEVAKERALEVGIDIPDGFVYEFLVGIGFGSLQEAFFRNAVDPEWSAGEVKLARAGKIDEIYLFRIACIVSMFLDVADIDSKQDKENIRRELFEKGDPHSIAQARLIDSRGDSFRADLKQANSKNTRMERCNAVVVEAIDSLLRKLNGEVEIPKEQLIDQLLFMRNGLHKTSSD